MQVLHHVKDTHGKFYIEQNGTVIAKMTYAVSQPGQMAIKHTEVDEPLRGGNVGHTLVDAAVQYAREHRLKIVPVCHFAKAVLYSTPEYSDVLL